MCMCITCVGVVCVGVSVLVWNVVDEAELVALYDLRKNPDYVLKKTTFIKC